MADNARSSDHFFGQYSGSGPTSHREDMSYTFLETVTPLCSWRNTLDAKSDVTNPFTTYITGYAATLQTVKCEFGSRIDMRYPVRSPYGRLTGYHIIDSTDRISHN